MDFEIKPFADLDNHLKEVFKTSFNFNLQETSNSVLIFKQFCSSFLPNLYCGIESKYIDKLYRDSYYHYYSSKLKAYNRDCIRLSFFSEAISLDDFYTTDGADKIQKLFLGFLVLRPIPNLIIGRNVLRPDIFSKAGQHLATTTIINASINGIKLNIEGFPHSSQDSEFMVCAETTLWSIMEYFSHRYPDYNPVLPKKIHSILANTSMQRQVPSTGLTGLQISYALKELGFGVKLYSANSYSNTGLYKIIQMYVESGIPVAAVFGNTKGITHVLTINGRTDFDLPNKHFTFSVMDKLPSGSSIYDYYEQPFNYLTIDDNQTPYATIPLSNPSANYTDPNWQNCTIYAAIVPLHNKIYKEADKAKEIAIQALKSIDPIMNLPSLVLRVLLSSSRSFKQSISLNVDLDKTTKTLITNLDMPKFVWIAEVGTIKSFEQGKATGMLLIDATEPKKPEILAYLLNNVYIGSINGVFNRYTLPLQPFSIHQNLKPF